MARIASADRVRIRALESHLATYSEESSATLAQTLAEALRELLHTDVSLVYGLEPEGDALALSFFRSVGFDNRKAEQLLDDGMRKRPVGWAAYNPIRLQPEQRNAVVTLGDFGEEAKKLPIVTDALPKLGLRGADQIRVLVCEGPAMLAWVGGYQHDQYEDWQKRILRRLVPALRRRMSLEHSLESGPVMKTAFVAALEAIALPAFLIATNGTIRFANAAGARLRDQDPRGTSLAMCECARRPEHAKRFTVTRVKTLGRADHFLVVARRDRSVEARARTLEAAARWGLSERQREVLALVVEGVTNRVIGATLGISERTIEVHLSALFERAQVETRAELAARVWWG